MEERRKKEEGRRKKEEGIEGASRFWVVLPREGLEN
jgi:hypothetical protein